MLYAMPLWHTAMANQSIASLKPDMLQILFLVIIQPYSTHHFLYNQYNKPVPKDFLSSGYLMLIQPTVDNILMIQPITDDILIQPTVDNILMIQPITDDILIQPTVDHILMIQPITDDILIQPTVDHILMIPPITDILISFNKSLMTYYYATTNC